jgi:CheY-like chemotaxis protein
MVRILIIDDSNFMRTVLRRFLEWAGHAVIEAEDGVQGVELYKQERPELVISDIVMPKKDGIATLRELRELDPQAKVIAISDGSRTGDQDYLAVARRHGANATLAKPFGREVIVALVDHILGNGDHA